MFLRLFVLLSNIQLVYNAQKTLIFLIEIGNFKTQ